MNLLYITHIHIYVYPKLENNFKLNIFCFSYSNQLVEMKELNICSGQDQYCIETFSDLYLL